jgi:hypothetical protein
MPSDRLAAMKATSTTEQQQGGCRPSAREQRPRGEQDHRHLDVADQDVGHDLAGHHLDRAHRHRQQVLEGAALALARHREAGHHDHGHGQDHAHQAGHDVVGGDALRVVAAMDAQVDRPGPRRQVGERAAEVATSAVSAIRVSAARALLVAAGSVASASTSSAGVRRAPGGARSRAGWSPRTAPRRGPAWRSAWRSSTAADEAEVVGCLQRRDERARELAGIAAMTTAVGRCPRVGVDGVAEEQQLHHRHADHHAEGQAVAAQLDELLDQDAESGEGEKPSSSPGPPGAASGG